MLYRLRQLHNQFCLLTFVLIGGPARGKGGMHRRTKGSEGTLPKATRRARKRVRVLRKSCKGTWENCQ